LEFLEEGCPGGVYCDDALDGDASLAGGVVAAFDDGVGCGVQIGVFGYDQG
jgi:hypothetical protein